MSQRLQVNAIATAPNAMLAAPIVERNGILDPELRVIELRASAPLDERSAILTTDRTLDPFDDSDRAAIRAYLGEAVSIGWSVSFGGEPAEMIWFTQGVIESADFIIDSERAQARLRVRGVDVLPFNSAIEPTRWERSGGSIGEDDDREPFRVYPIGNRSTSQSVINGVLTHVFKANAGDPWTIATMLRSLGADLGAEWETALLDTAIADAPSLGAYRRESSIAACARAILDQFALSLRMDADVDDKAVQLLWRGAERGPLTSLSGIEAAAPALRAEALRSALAPTTAETIIVRGRRRVESTFTLRGGWDPAGQGLATTEYDRSTSTNFGAVRNVYRRWVLNEDGAFDGPPYGQIPFDSSSFFGDALEPQAPLRFHGMLAHAWTDGRYNVCVEYSVNSGGAWSELAVAFHLLSDRAGLYISEDALPANFASAGNAGTLRVRITATLEAARPVERSIINGDINAPSMLTRVIDFKDNVGTFEVGAASRFHAQVQLGTLAADERDDTALMDSHLTELARVPPDSGEMELTLGPIDPSIQAGDRVRRVGVAAGDGWRIDLLGGGGVSGSATPRIVEVRHLLDQRQQTVVKLKG